MSALLFLSACSAYDPALVEDPPEVTEPTIDGGNANAGAGGGQEDGGIEGGMAGVGGSSGSGGSGGSGGDAGICFPNPDVDNEVCPEICPEICNNKDDDCNRRIDDGEAASAGCMLTHADSVCERGVCIIAKCEPGYRDCDNKPDNGCEAADDDINNCGVCGKKCGFTNGLAACVNKACVRTGCTEGWDDCDADPDDCETAIDTLQNCAGCGLVCENVDNATASCEQGYCGPGDCIGNFGDCNLAPGDGCEEKLDSNTHCGGCNTPCSLPGTDTECSTGSCLGVACNDPSYDECDGDISNGCESLNGSAHCGACGKACDASLPNATSGSCQNLACTLTCASTHADCDADAQTGCETVLGTIAHCSDCSPCVLPNAVAACTSGECTIADCDVGWNDCQNGADDGCETPDSNDNCGSCGNQCTGGKTCVGGTCTAADCNVAPFNDDCGGASCGNCDGNDADCETNLTSSLVHCGACNNACTFTTGTPNATLACTATGCKAVCSAGFGDCNGDYKDGCEQPLNTLDNCDGCGKICAIPNSSAQCTTWSAGHYLCQIAGCQPGYADCDNDMLTCESPLDTPQHCGSCSNVCNLQNASEACTGPSGSLACTIAACDQPYFKNCDNQDSTGCEVDARSDVANCNACNNDCRNHDNVATATCASSACSYTCDSGFEDCTSTPGCETDVKTLSNCGGCGVMCSRANATATCSTGTCAIASCNNGFDDCDANAANGCEPLNTLTDCGSCGAPCAVVNGTGTCATGTCAKASCNVGWDDCDGGLDCERNTNPPASGGSGPCLPDTGCVKQTYGGHEYFFCPTARTWADARTHCEQQLLGNLVRIDDTNENTFVKNNLTVDAWVGATDTVAEGNWRWIDNDAHFWTGTSTGGAVGGLFANWNGGEPNNSSADPAGEDCATMIGSGANAGKWNDLLCTSTSAFVCEVQGDVCPNDPTKVNPGQCGCGNPDTDGDSDGTADCNDGCPSDANKVAAGQCGCGNPDTDGDNDGTANCVDGCPADGGKTAPGVCGCGVADTNTDGDAELDCNDDCPSDPTKTVGPCGFPYTPSNFDPLPLTYVANVNVNCNATITSADSTTAVTICGTSITPVIQTQTGGPKLFILPMASLTVGATFTLKLNGALPVVLAVLGNASVAGTIDAGSVAASTLGAGANVSCTSAGAGGIGVAGGFGDGTVGGGSGGGGGGGFGSAGAAGGKGALQWWPPYSSGDGGGGGAVQGSATLVPLRGGCRGGSGGGGSSVGGYGGGAVQLTVGGALTLSSTAVVTAAGGGAPKGTSAVHGGGGAGSGGAILLEATTLGIDASAWIAANGGGAASGGGLKPGTDGFKNNTAQAPGGTGNGPGGKGGALAGAATAGGAGDTGSGDGGGGGGAGVGRIRIHGLTAGCSVPTARVSPAASVACP